MEIPTPGSRVVSLSILRSNYVESSPVNLSTGSQIAGQDILTKPNSCTDGQILVYSMSTGSWACGNDSDTTLTASEVQAMVESVAGLPLKLELQLMEVIYLQKPVP